MNDTATELWLVDVDFHAPALTAAEEHWPRLSPGEESRATQFADPIEQRRRRAAFIVRRLALERMFGPALRRIHLPRDTFGRPHLPADIGPGAFSLAHSGPYVLAACSRAAVIGVDIETPRPIKMDARRQSILIAAAGPLCAAPLPAEGDARFLQAWTRLEALAKADGRGIGHLVTRIGAAGGDQGTPAYAARLASEHACCVTDLAIAPDYAAALALSASSAASITLHTAPACIELLLAIK